MFIMNSDSSLIFPKKILQLNDKNIKDFSYNNKIIESLISIYNDYPDIKTQYIIEDIFLKIDKSLENNFLKRIAIISDEHNLSIHFFNCHQTNIDKKFFQAGPFFDFKQ